MNPIYDKVVGAPHQPDTCVRVTDAVDREVYDVSAYIGQIGVVRYLEYSSGVGQRFPQDPMINVVLDDGQEESFWQEELEAVHAHGHA